jgi:hypothetical protein
MEFVFDFKLEFDILDWNVEVASIPSGMPDLFT